MDRSEWVLVRKDLLESFPEINPSNYDHDDACELNRWGAELVTSAAPPPPAEQASGEDMHDDLPLSDLLAEAERIAANQYKDGRYAAARVLRILCHRLSQRPVVDEAMEDRVIDALGRAGLQPPDRPRLCLILTAALAPQQQGECKHEWVDARNRHVQSGEVCLKCHAMRAGNTAAPQQPTGEESHDAR